MARPTATSPACSRRSPAPRSSGSPSGFPGGIAGKAHALPVCAGAIARSPWSWAPSSSTPASTRRRRRSCRRTSTASRSPLRRAAVSDGATAASFADQTATFGYDEAAPYFWTLLTAGRVFSGSSPGPPLEERVADISPTPLLLIGAGGFPTEIDFNRHYAQVANEPFEYWELPEVGHTAAVRERPEEYERRVVGFFDEALLGRGTS